MQYVVEVVTNDPAFKVKPKFYTNGRDALTAAHRHKSLFPFHRVQISLYREVK